MIKTGIVAGHDIKINIPDECAEFIVNDSEKCVGVDPNGSKLPEIPSPFDGIVCPSLGVDGWKKAFAERSL